MGAPVGERQGHRPALAGVVLRRRPVELPVARAQVPQAGAAGVSLDRVARQPRAGAAAGASQIRRCQWRSAQPCRRRRSVRRPLPLPATAKEEQNRGKRIQRLFGSETARATRPRSRPAGPRCTDPHKGEWANGTHCATLRGGGAPAARPHAQTRAHDRVPREQIPVLGTVPKECYALGSTGSASISGSPSSRTTGASSAR